MLIGVAAVVVLLLANSLRGLVERNRSAPFDEVQFLTSVAADLRSGASVRTAIAGTAHHSSVAKAQRLAVAGAPLDEVAVAIEDLPINGQRAAAALQVVARAGGRSAAVFDGLADRAMEAAERARERRALTTQARLSAGVVGGLPVVSLLLGGADRIGLLIGSGNAGIAVAAIAVTMQGVGIGIVWRMAKT